MTKNFNVLIVENNEFILTGIKDLLDKSDQTNNNYYFVESLEKLNELNVEVDLYFIDVNCIESKKWKFKLNLDFIKDKYSKIVFIIWEQNKTILRNILSLNPDGIICRPSNIDILLEAIQITKNGGTYFNSSILKDIYSQNIRSGFFNLSILSKREVEIVNFITMGLTSREIADKLYLSKFTVENHRKNIIRKLNVKNSFELIYMVNKAGMLEN